jgi:RNA polymerase sigma factor (sigma-70 family)
MTETPILLLIQQSLNGDAKSEEALYRRFAPQVMSIARRYTRDDAMAQDYMQECFVVLFEKLKKYDSSKGEFEPWLYRLCVNQILQLIRKNNRKINFEELPTELQELEIQENEMDLLDNKVLLAAIRELPDGYREVFNLSVIDNWSHKEISTALKITESSSRSQLARAKSLLRQKLYKIIRHHEQKLV